MGSRVKLKDKINLSNVYKYQILKTIDGIIQCGQSKYFYQERFLHKRWYFKKVCSQIPYFLLLSL